MDKKILKDPSLETSLFCCHMTSTRLPRMSRILEDVCVEISTLVLKFASSYTKSSYGPLVSAIFNVSICPSDMSWEMLLAMFSATLNKDLVRIHKEIKLSVNFLCWGIFSEFRPHKVDFLKIEKSDRPQRWCVVILGSITRILPSGLASNKVELEIDLYFSRFTYTKPSLQYLDLPHMNQILRALAPLDLSSMGIITTVLSPNSIGFTQHLLETRLHKPWHPTKICPIFFDTYCVFEKDFDSHWLCFLFANHSPQLYITYDNFSSVIYCMVHEIGVFECACSHIFGMFSPYPTFQKSYLMTQISISPQKYIKLIPNTISTLVTLELSFQTAIPMHYTLICVHGPIYMDHGAPLARFSCPKPFCPNFWPDCPTTQNFSPENFMDQIFSENFFENFFDLYFSI